MPGLLARTLQERALRGRHNDFDFACEFWRGDRRPDPGDTVNREFGGKSTPLNDRRCLVCRPFTPEEADALIEEPPLALIEVAASRRLPWAARLRRRRRLGSGT